MSFIREEKISEQVRRRSETVIEKERVDFLNTGSILLNLAASQKARNGGWARGRIINIVGDGSSGKSLSAIEALAQAYYHPTLESTIFKKPHPLLFSLIGFSMEVGLMLFCLLYLFQNSELILSIS